MTTSPTEKDILNAAGECDSIEMFRADKPELYDAAIAMGILGKVFSHIESSFAKSKRRPNLLGHEGFTDQDLRLIARRYSSRDEFLLKSPSAYAAAASASPHFLSAICAHMSSANRPESLPKKPGRPRLNLSFDDVLVKALEFNSRSDFSAKAPSHYKFARENYFLDKVCAHMRPHGNSKQDCPGIMEVFEEARKYRSLTDFREGSPHIYRAAWDARILAQACDHMNTPGERTSPAGEVKSPHLIPDFNPSAMLLEVSGRSRFSRRSPRLDAPLGLIRPDVENSIEWHEQALAFLNMLLLRDEEDFDRAANLLGSAKKDALAFFEEGTPDQGLLEPVLVAVREQGKRLATLLVNQASGNLDAANERLNRTRAIRDKKKAQLAHARRIGADWFDPEFFEVE